MRVIILTFLMLSLLPPVATASTVGAITGGSGGVEYVTLRFDSTLDLASTTAADFQVSSCSCPPATIAAEGSTLRLTLSGPLADTAATPAVVYSAPADGMRVAGDPVASFTVTPADGTPPVPVSATAWGTGRSDAVLHFSEPVAWKGNLDEGLTRADLGYDDASAGGASAIDGVIHEARSPRADLILRGGFAAADDGTDRIRVLANAVADVSGNVANPASVPLVADVDPPGGVTGFSANVGGTSSITLKLTAPNDEDVERIEIRMSTEEFAAADFTAQRAVSGVPARVAPSQALSVVVEGLEPGQHHFFAARAIDRNANRGPVSEVIAATTQRDTFPPNAPAALSVAPGGQGTRWLGLTWTVPTDHDGTPIERYELRVAEGKTADPATGAYTVPPDPVSPGSQQRFLLTDLRPGTGYTIGLRAFDEAGLVSPWTTAEVTTAVDETPPFGTLVIESATHEAGVPSERSVLDVTWSGAEDDGSSIVYLYRIDRSATRAPEWTDAWTQANHVSGHVLGEGQWFVHVAAWSAGGQLLAEPFKVVVDRDAPPPPPAPRLVSAGYGEATLRVGPATDAERLELRWGLEEVTDATWLQAKEAGSVTGAGELAVAGLPAQTPIHFAARAIDAAGRTSDVGAGLVIETLLDPTPPTGALELTSNHQTLRSLGASWSRVVDNETAVVYHYALTRGPAHVVALTDNATEGQTATFEVELSGTWQLHVRPRSMGGWGQQETLAVETLPPPPDQLDKAQAIPLTVRREGDTNTLEWTLPPELRNAMGVQLWVGNSPFKLLTNIEGGTASNGSFVHGGPDAQPDSRYAATAYFTRDPAGGYHLAPPDTLAAVQASSAGSSAWQVLSWAFLALLAIGMGTGGWLVWQRRSDAPGEASEVEAWKAPPQESGWHAFNGDADDGFMDEDELGLDDF